MKIFLFPIIVVLLLAAGSACAVEKPAPDEVLLRDIYLRNQTDLAKNNFGLPLFLKSFEQDEKVHVDVYGIFAYPFSSIADVLRIPANWCDIVALHPNVKACTYTGLPDAWLLTLYLGRKVYQPPEDTRQVIYHYRNVVRRPGYLDVVLSADAGPFGTKDHRIRFEALPLDGNRTFVHVSYDYRDTVGMRLATKGYFATLGRGKVGFTVTETDRSGQPVYIGGPRGAIERNAVRYYLAIQSFMSTLRYPAEKQFSMRLSEWYDLTLLYQKQLFDLSKKDYLAFKTAEHENQVTLQRSLGTEPQ